jgi:hypothetical protein
MILILTGAVSACVLAVISSLTLTAGLSSEATPPLRGAEADAFYRPGNKAGSKPGPIWKFFWAVTPYDKVKKRHTLVQCQRCDKDVEGRPDHMKRHVLNECTKVSESDRNQLQQREASTLGDGGVITGRPAKQARGQGQSSVTEFFRTNKQEEAEKKVIDAKILRFFVTSGLAWMQASSAFFIDLICYLRPGYVPPGVSRVASFFVTSLRELTSLCTYCFAYYLRAFKTS